MAPPLTWLYVPADRVDRIGTAMASTADVVILDLEDAVAPSHKEAARTAVLDALLDARYRNRAIEVRINDPRSSWGRDDLDALCDARGEQAAQFGIRVPKVATAEMVRAVVERFGEVAPPTMTCLIESSLGIEQAFLIATAHAAVGAIALGEADLAADLGVADEGGLAWSRARIVVAARAAGLPSPAMSAWLRLSDLDGLAASCESGRALGFLGRSAIHPSQLPVIAAAFMPTPDEIEAAQRLLEALAAATALDLGGAVLPDGRFVDQAHVRSAQRTLMLAARTHRASNEDQTAGRQRS